MPEGYRALEQVTGSSCLRSGPKGREKRAEQENSDVALWARGGGPEPRLWSEYRPYGERVVADRVNTDLAGKREALLRSLAALQISKYRPPIPTLWGNNTDRRGKGGYRYAGRRALRAPSLALISCLSTGSALGASPVRPFLTVTDPVGKEYRSSGERIPTRWGDFYRSRGENIPTLPGHFTDRAGVYYRPSGETCWAKYLQTCIFLPNLFVYMMFCLCLVFCLVNREVLGG